MADNLSVTPGSGVTIASDDVGGVQYQRVKLEHGFDGKSVSDPMYAAISAALSGANNLLIPADASFKLRIVSLFLVATNVVNVKIYSDTTPISGLIALDQKSGFVLPFNPSGWFQAEIGKALKLELSAAVEVGGFLTFVKEAG